MPRVPKAAGTRPPLVTEAVVLRKTRYRDADLVVTLFTRGAGKVSALAHSAQRSRKRFGAALDLFSLSRAHLREQRQAQLWTLAAAELIEPLAPPAADLAAMAHASYGSELVRELTAAEQPDGAVFDLLLELYRTLGQRGASAPLLCAFELKLLTALGLAPVLDRCLVCASAQEQELGRGAVIDPARGGLVCTRCAAQHGGIGSRHLSSEARSWLLALLAQPTLAHAAGDHAAKAAGSARDALAALIGAHVGKPLRSLEFISKLREPPGKPAR